MTENPNPDLDSRIAGCRLGGAVGDALGAPVEFWSLARIRRQFGPGGIRDFVPAHGKVGAITDDTQMTLFTAEGLIRAHLSQTDSPATDRAAECLHRADPRWLATQGDRPAERRAPATAEG